MYNWVFLLRQCMGPEPRKAHSGSAEFFIFPIVTRMCPCNLDIIVCGMKGEKEGEMENVKYFRDFGEAFLPEHAVHMGCETESCFSSLRAGTRCGFRVPTVLILLL
jgi:hypothetical protein